MVTAAILYVVGIVLIVLLLQFLRAARSETWGALSPHHDPDKQSEIQQLSLERFDPSPEACHDEEPSHQRV